MKVLWLGLVLSGCGAFDGTLMIAPYCVDMAISEIYVRDPGDSDWGDNRLAPQAGSVDYAPTLDLAAGQYDVRTVSTGCVADDALEGVRIQAGLVTCLNFNGDLFFDDYYSAMAECS